MSSNVKVDPAVESSGPLLSRSSILIISGLLLGITSAEAIDSGVRSSAFFAGACGLVAFCALEYVGRMRRSMVRRQAEREAITKHEQRIDQHIRPRHEADAV